MDTQTSGAGHFFKLPALAVVLPVVTDGPWGVWSPLSRQESKTDFKPDAEIAQHAEGSHTKALRTTGLAKPPPRLTRGGEVL